MKFFFTIRRYSTPSSAIRWFYATDVPVSKPRGFNYKQTVRPKKFIPFARTDSDNLEAAFRAWKNGGSSKEVAVNEDQLFDCNLEKMIMRPAYWEGPAYEIRRGLWFLDNMPLPAPIADQLEQKYTELGPFNEPRASDEPVTAEIVSEVSLYEQEGKKWPFEEATDFEKEDKIAVFKDHKTAFMISKDSKVGKLQIKNFYKLPAQQVLGADTVTRGYEKTEAKKTEEGSEEKMDEEKDLLTSWMKSWTGQASNERFQKDMEADYTNPNFIANSGDREVDHLILCIHGIGQTLSYRFTSINFAHDCNNMRRQFKQLFTHNPKYVKMAYSEDEIARHKNDGKLSNCKVQVLPIIWRSDVDFSLDKVFDEYEPDGHARLPTLNQINIDAITPLRHLAADVVMDILLFYEPRFKQQILSSVVKYANAIYDKYVERHPQFDGKISLLGHSLGSAICLDILCSQPDSPEDIDPEKHLKFPVENFFGLGSPNGVFKLIQGHNIRARDSANHENVSSPKVGNYYNIFYPTDPVAYRVEPLVHSLLAGVKPKTISFEDDSLNSQIQSLAELPNNLINNEYLRRAINFAGLGDVAQLGEKQDKILKPTEQKEIPDNVKKLLEGLNRTGRVDYSLPQGYFDIDLFNAVGSHIQYFDDRDVVGFLLTQLWPSKKQ
ncbi:hypothetical protein KL941_004057 [Ogataea angusta]|nr:hypothetical protein KL941_004057 [Ogataea angusta]